jgi:hypothetical protein
MQILDCVGIVNELPLLPNNTASGIFLRKSGVMGSVAGYLSLRRGPACDGANM